MFPPDGTTIKLKYSSRGGDGNIAGTIGELSGNRTVLNCTGPDLRSLSVDQTLEMCWEEPGIPTNMSVRVAQVEPDSGKLVVEAERRNHMRVDCSLTFRYRPLSDADYEAMIPRIRIQTDDSLEEYDSTSTSDEIPERLEAVFVNFHRMLREIDDQVKHLIAVQEGTANSEQRDRSGRVFNISGCGLAFEETKPVKVGTKLKMTFDLAGYPFRSIVCLGEVTRCETTGQTIDGMPIHQVYAGIDHISEEDQDRIIRFVFKVQRRQLRRRSRSKN